MPFLHHGNSIRSRISSIVSPSWWRRKISKSSGAHNFKSNRDDDPAHNTATRDWRSLSPNDPPLPFVPDNDFAGTNADTIMYTQVSERSPKHVTTIPNRYRQSLNDGSLQKLSTIIEESDLITEISVSPRSSNSHHHHHQRQRNYHQQQQYEMPAHTGEATPLTRPNLSKNNDIIVVPLPPSSATEPSHPPSTTTSSSGTSSSTSSSSSSSSTSSSSSANSFQPPPAWPVHPKTERRWSATPSPIPTNEKKAKRKFAKMVQAALKFRQDNKHQMPSEMEILFDPQGNIINLRLWMHGKIQHHVFQGDAQYIPPELSTRRAYHCDLVDVWVLGISLYRMLVGKYPFHANNDRRLFNKMQYADFGIPSHLSADAKDLLRRMLAPDHSRASLDLVMFHPWLKPYTVIQPSFDNNNKIKTPSPTPSSRVAPDPPAPPPHGWQLYHKHGKKSSLALHFQKLMVFIVQGPYPPPKQPYRDLVPTA